MASTTRKSTENILATIMACIILLGCAGPDYMSQHYEGPTMLPKYVATKDGEFKIFDNPKEGRLLVLPTFGRGFMYGTPPIPQARGAAIAWFAKAGRKCRITDGYLVTDPMHEFLYSCSK